MKSIGELHISSADRAASEFRQTWSWRWTIGGAAIPAGMLCACTTFLPESPRWLVRGWRGLGQSWLRPAVVAALGIAAF